MKFSSVQMFRAIAANVVVLAHLHGIEGKYGKGYVCLPDWIGLSGFTGVHFFFVISGCVIVISSQGAKWLDFMAARVTRIYPIYWFYTTIYLLAIVLVPQSVGIGTPSPASILRSYLLWPDYGAPLLTVGWSLVFEMYFYVILAIVLVAAIPLRRALPLWAGVVLLLGLFSQQQNPLLLLVGSPLVFEFIAGALVGLAIVEKHASYGRVALMAGLATLPVGLIRYFFYAPDVSFLTVMLLAIPFSLLLYTGLSYETGGQWPRLRWMVLLGDASYSTYLSHSLVLSAMGRMFSLSPFYGWLAEAGFVLLCIVVANLVGILSYQLLERPSLKLCRALLGAMKPKRVVAQ